MPLPSSRTTMSTHPASQANSVVPAAATEAESQTDFPGSLYLIALSTRLITACSKSGALTAVWIDSSHAISNTIERSTARGIQSAITAAKTSAIGTISNGRLPVPSLCSIRDSARRSSIMEANRSACFAMISKNRRLSAGSSAAPSSSVSTNPLIEATGVLSSCDTFATKSRRTLSKW